MSDGIEFDKYSIAEIDKIIAWGMCTEQDVIEHYGNEFWRDSYEG